MSNIKKYMVNKFINAYVSVHIVETANFYEVECEINQKRKPISKFNKKDPNRAYKRALKKYRAIVEAFYVTYGKMDPQSLTVVAPKENQSETVEQYLARGGAINKKKVA